ncbi:MAG: prepilin-type N-terminal cleavage/methylation domain-containing protein [Phycisphaerales bacterium]|nr:prepilin-type N-terminal cleavage/methylation domain-containing protein [Phycisphaerales bacterium]
MSFTARTHVRCFTLIELLAVLVLLSSVGALSIGALGRLPNVHQERAAIDAVMRAWERTSLLARRSNGAVLMSEGEMLVADAPQPAPAPTARALTEHFPRRWRVELNEDEPIPFDVNGYSTDIRCKVTRPDGTQMYFTLLGVTGQRLDEDESP